MTMYLITLDSSKIKDQVKYEIFFLMITSIECIKEFNESSFASESKSDNRRQFFMGDSTKTLCTTKLDLKKHIT